LITGAASGIGKACAKAFAVAGCRHIVLVDRDSSGLEATVKEMAVDSSRLTIHVLDIQDDTAVEKLVLEIPEKHGALDYALNCAGITGGPGKIHETEMKEIDMILKINLRAQVLFCRAEVKAMLASKRSADEKERGTIVNWASIMSNVAIFGDNAAYIIAKHAIVGLTKSMASAYGVNGIRTNAVAPGFIETAMTKDTTEKGKAYLMGRTPIGRPGQSEEVAAAVVFLCSPASSFMNGAIVPIDGGFLAR